MKRRFTILTAAFMLLAFLAIPMGMMGQTRDVESFTFSELGYANGDEVTTVEGDNVTLTFDQGEGTNPPKYYTTGAGVRMYTNNTLDVVLNDQSSDVRITAISFTFAGTYSGSLQNWTGDETSVSFTNTGSQARIQVIEVTFSDGGTPTPTTYTVTYDCNGGTSGCPENVTGIEAGTTITLANAPTKTDYDFAGWNDGNNTYDEGDEYTVNGNVTFTAQWTENIIPVPGITDVLNYYFTGISGTSYADWSDKTGSSGAVYAGNSGGQYSSIQLRSSNNNSGIVTTTTAGNVTRVSVTWNSNTQNGRTLNVYGKNSPYTDATDLFGSNAGTLIGTIVCGTSTELVISDSYKHIGLRSASGAMYLTEIQITWANTSVIATPTIAPESGTIFGDEGLTVTISCETQGVDIFYTLDGSDPDDGSTPYNGPINLTETTTVKAIAYDSDDNTSNVASATYIYVDPNAPGTQNNPFTVAQAIENTPSSGTTDNVYIRGIVSSFYNTNIMGDGNNYRYYISDDGTTTTQLLVYKGKGLDQTTFANVDDLLVGDEVVIYGKLTMYQNAPEIASGNYLTSWVRPTHNVATPTFSPEAGNYTEAQTVTINCDTDGATIYYTTDGTTPTNEKTQYNGPITVSTATTIKAIAYVDDETSFVAVATYHINSQANPYTVTQALSFYEYPANGIYVQGIVSTAPTATPTSDGELTYYISVDGNTNNQLEIYKGKGMDNVAFTTQNDIQVGDIVTVYGNVVVYNGTKEFAQGNYLVSFEHPENPNGLHWTVNNQGCAEPRTYITGVLTIDGVEVYNGEGMQDAGGGNLEIGVFDQDGICRGAKKPLWRSRSSQWIYSIQLYGNEGMYYPTFKVYDHDTDTELNLVLNIGEIIVWSPTFRYGSVNNPYPINFTYVYTLDINGYTEGSNGGYYLIASPVNVNPENVEGMTTGNFDLYYFDEAQDNEWINYKGENGNFNLVPGKGYLYAKQATTEGEIFHFELTGAPYDGDGTIELNYTEGGDFPGWNLVGNPYNEEAGLNLPFYRMNTEGTELEPVSQGTVNPMEGVFVIAQTDPETGDINNAQFTAGMGSNSGEDKLVLNVSRNRGNVVDRAIVRFGQGGVLPKFQLNENSTKLYIVEGENEYAVVRSANEGEMPVSFKASENGNYTLSVNAENVEMEYLHLIDNMTGTDVDLLATPSYSFEARTNDYESRFRLVFSGNTNVGSSTSSETFAFFNGNSWVINNEGEATLQVIDIMGRVLSNEQINGSYNNSLNLSAGVYVLRLSNGNTVKTQKVVVD